MILSEKYKLEETDGQITLKELYQSAEKVDGVETGNFTTKERTLGYYGHHGRAQIYRRMLNMEISNSEKQDIKTILEIVEGFEEQCAGFFGK